MRAITASGIVPSAIAGSIRCEAALRNAPLSPRQQRVDQHEAGDARDVVLDRDAARHRRPAEPHREEQDEQQAPPEDRHRVAGERRAHHRVVDDACCASPPRSRPRAGRSRARTASRTTRQLDRRRKARGEFGHHRLVRDRSRCRGRRAARATRSRRTAPAAAGRARTRAAAAHAARRSCRARPTGPRPGRPGSGGSARTPAA